MKLGMCAGMLAVHTPCSVVISKFRTDMAVPHPQENYVQNGLSQTEGEAVVPAALQADLVQIEKLILTNNGPGGFTERDLTRITVPAGGVTQWTIPTPKGDVQVDVIEAVVISASDRRVRYTTKYGSAKRTPPTCYSADEVTGMGDPGGNCSTCSYAKFGSDENDAQACRQYREVFVLQGENLLPSSSRYRGKA